jgi:hypothetical protein
LRRKLPVGLKVFLGVLLIVCSMSGLVLATPAEEAELEQLTKIEEELELQREWVEYRLKRDSAVCYQKFWVNYCLRDVRADYRKELDPIRAQEVAVREAQRILRESLKNQDDVKRAADRAAPEKAAERAANQREYEEKQKDAAARAADLEQRRKDAPKRAQENKAGTQLD